ncbi:MAG: hypothetical protein UR46_C0010G0004 [Parcubacteria group bacterium GW2011_GWA1_33_6]|uniref:Uncharacterized protein n=1 Tax=Candidatus Staskawiczbacteria bacterium RIFCSPHIGHO2_02_FULL_33_16 TaxID=1802204 RepID=A0A1G2HTB0_9BACT|nr:MAG: hypothetical protein UR31_C0005G0006 [Parcubacteria group bacterium GW2011_GWA2_33_14]KKP54981.1 MAG: hypothetical protein UR46_C0010G0004 [Parcubacteria group bacterium GW2011_GWA1_33_6]OGZ65471.1 MAG: hypothetical protein A3D34_03060 [Candidatus Staskawiczbacteria bacterium RIFCSPHIGHO2_02_FULL_33_16]OGZ69988.1 MAG: hypothetical protein A2980_03415 [Candidatus Staskawiczbacteria bacterium RIFCSPLOWO2_01_FULL_33_13]
MKEKKENGPEDLPAKELVGGKKETIEMNEKKWQRIVQEQINQSHQFIDVSDVEGLVSKKLFFYPNAEKNYQALLDLRDMEVVSVGDDFIYRCKEQFHKITINYSSVYEICGPSFSPNDIMKKIMEAMEFFGFNRKRLDLEKTSKMYYAFNSVALAGERVHNDRGRYVHLTDAKDKK